MNMKTLLVLLLLIPSLSWGAVTFKNGKQVEDEPETFIIEGNKSYTKLSKDDYLKLSFKKRANLMFSKLNELNGLNC